MKPGGSESPKQKIGIVDEEVCVFEHRQCTDADHDPERYGPAFGGQRSAASAAT